MVPLSCRGRFKFRLCSLQNVRQTFAQTLPTWRPKLSLRSRGIPRQGIESTRSVEYPDIFILWLDEPERGELKHRA